MSRVVVAALLLVCGTPVCLADADADLITAVTQHDIDAAAMALRNGAAADARGMQQATALMMAAEHGDTSIMRALLDAGADANALRSGGVTPLMHAAAGGDAAAVKILIDAKAKLSARATKNGMTALRAAVTTGSVESVKLLLSAGADRNEQDDSGARLLFAAAGAGSVELVELFLVAGEDVNRKRTAGGFTALDVALERQNWAAAQYLIEHGATLRASETGTSQALRKLLELEAVVQPGKANPLVQAVALPSIDLMRAVLAQGASTDFTDDKGNTPLMLAARRHHVTAVEALIAAGADVQARNAEGDTALSIAAGKSEYELIVVGLGLALGQTRDSLTRLVFRPAQKSSESEAAARRLQAARALLGAKADPNIADELGDTPLIKATRTGDAELVGLLISAGADVNARSGSGAAALLVAAQFGLEEIAATLLRADADASIQDGDGHSPIDLARKGNHQGIVQLLQQAAKI
jgi:ankyrin repeat protein